GTSAAALKRFRAKPSRRAPASLATVAGPKKGGGPTESSHAVRDLGGGWPLDGPLDPWRIHANHPRARRPGPGPTRHSTRRPESPVHARRGNGGGAPVAPPPFASRVAVPGRRWRRRMLGPHGTAHQVRGAPLRRRQAHPGG